MQCRGLGMESFSRNGLIGVGSTHKIAAPLTRQKKRATSPSSTISLLSMYSEPNTHHGVIDPAVLAAASLSAHHILEPSSASDGTGESHGAVAKDTNFLNVYAWASNLSSMERFKCDDQRHERLAVSLALCHPSHLPFLPASKDTRISKMPAKAGDNPPTDQSWEDIPYCESSYDPYDQPPPADGLPSPSALPAPNVSFQQYRDLMKEFFAPEDQNAASTEKTGEPPPLKTKEAAVAVETSPPPPSRRDSMSIQALLNNAEPPHDPSPEHRYSPPQPQRIQQRHHIHQPHRIQPTKVASISPLHLEPDPSLDCEDNDGTIRAFTEQAHTRIEENRSLTRNQRTVRRATLRKRKREGDHPAGRAHPAAPREGE